MRLSGVMVALLLAGCSALAPPPAAQEAANDTLPIPRLTPTLPQGCLPTIVIEPHGFALAPGVGAWWDVVLRSSGSCPARLAYGGVCARDILAVTIGEEGWAAPFERGAAWANETVCTPQGWNPEEPPSLPYGFELRRRYHWNGTVGEACEGSRIGQCVTFRDAAPGTYPIRAWAFAQAGEVLHAEVNMTVYPFCTDLFLVGAAPGHHEVTLAVDNETVGGAAWTDAEGPVPLGRWCGARGERWLTLVDAVTGEKEEAVVRLDAERTHLRTSPLRTQPLIWS